MNMRFYNMLNNFLLQMSDLDHDGELGEVTSIPIKAAALTPFQVIVFQFLAYYKIMRF